MLIGGGEALMTLDGWGSFPTPIPSELPPKNNQIPAIFSFFILLSKIQAGQISTKRPSITKNCKAHYRSESCASSYKYCRKLYHDCVNMIFHYFTNITENPETLLRHARNTLKAQ